MCCLVAGTVLAGLGCERPPYATTVGESYGELPVQFQECKLVFRSSSFRYFTPIPFTIVIPGSRERRRLCLSYLQDRPFRWIVWTKEGNPDDIRGGSNAPGWEKAYDGAPVAVEIPEGGYLKIRGRLPRGAFPGPGKYRPWVDIYHMSSRMQDAYPGMSDDLCEDMYPGWPEEDEGFWLGLIQSDEVDLEITPRD